MQKKNNEPIVSLGSKNDINITPRDMSTLNNSRFNFSNAVFTVFESITLKGTKSTSKISRVVSTVNYFVRLQNGQMGAIKYFFVCDCDVYVFVEVYSLIQQFDHLLQVQNTETDAVFSIKEIASKLIYMAIATKEVVTAIPNKFEKT